MTSPLRKIDDLPHGYPRVRAALATPERMTRLRRQFVQIVTRGIAVSNFDQLRPFAGNSVLNTTRGYVAPAAVWFNGLEAS